VGLVTGIVLAGSSAFGVLCGLLVLGVSMSEGGGWVIGFYIALTLVVGLRIRRNYRRYLVRARAQIAAQEQAAMLASVEEQFPEGWTGEIMEYKRVVRR
jgi:hypothetical protein